jgi:hypothetical protein
VSRQGTAFDYSSPAELYLSRRRGRHTDYRRFGTAAEAIRYAVKELRTRRSLSAWMQVGDETFNKSEINRLYYPLNESLSAPPVERLGSTRLSVRIDLAAGGHLGSGKIALLEAIQAHKSISGAARSLGMPRLRALIGAQIVDLYREMEASAQLAADAELRAIEALARGGGEQ